ncbi:MipA/OmpV family protein [Massilia arenosa]|uniref:MipA/OmpV family protein n=1 Tax=Zemynaea arenosa TaxID=2561931 RepID=A0A4Y9SL51_9BURK|nr:MipA/OmpV family protein [Massilia arenosa]
MGCPVRVTEAVERPVRPVGVRAGRARQAGKQCAGHAVGSVPRLAAAAALAVACGAAGAAPLPLWEAGIGLGAVSTPAYPASADRSSRALVLPFIIYRGEVIRSDQGGIGARVLHSDVYELDVGFAASLPARSDDVAARQGMPNLGPLGEFGPRLRVNLGNPTPASRLRLDLPVRTVIEVRGGLHKRGWVTEPRLIWETRDATGQWTFDAHVAAAFGDRSINDYFYGVSTQYATAARPTYAADAGLILTRIGASTSYKVSEDVRVFAYTRYENYSASANKASPLYLKSSGTSAGIGLLWTLGRSSTPAAR